MLFKILYTLGGMAIGILAMLVCFAMVLAVPGSPTKGRGEAIMKKAITALIMLTPSGPSSACGDTPMAGFSGPNLTA